MTLALITYRNGPKDMESETSAMFFYVGGIAAITLVVNATTSNALLVKLKLLGNDSAEKAIVMASIQKKLLRHMHKALQDLASEFHFNERELDEVRQSVSLLSDVSIKDIMSAVEAQKEFAAEQKALHRKMSIVKMEHKDPLQRVPLGEAATNPLHGGADTAAVDIHQVPHDRTRRNTFERRMPPTGSEHGTPLYGGIAEDEEMGDGGFDVIEMLEAGHNTRNNRSRGSSNADVMHRRLSMSGRGPLAMITPQLLTYVRSTFLSMVRVHYWHDIEQGKLPRKSKSGKFLLYSVEVGLDEASMESGARDWVCVEGKLDAQPLEMKLLVLWEERMPEHWLFSYPTRYLNKLECNREERTVYILTSFINAHEHAQEKIHGFLRVDEDDDSDMQQSPEELKVIAESKLAVTIARRRLENINPETVAAIRTKQAAALILTKQADHVKGMVHEGLLTPKDAEEIIDGINKDMQGIDKKRNRMYLQHGDSSSRRRKELRKMGDIQSGGSLLANADL